MESSNRVDLQSQKRAQPGAGQCGEDRNRMDQALVEHAEDNINREQRGQDEDGLIGHRLLENLSVTGKAAGYSCGHVQFAHGFSMTCVARSRDTPGARLNEIVTAANWP